MIVFERVRVPIKSMRNNDLFFVDVDLLHVPAEKIHAANHFANGINDISQIQIARCDLVQHWREKEKVFAIDNGDLKVRISALLKLQGRIKPTEAAAENKYTSFIRSMMDNLSRNGWNAYRIRKAAVYRHNNR